MTAPAQRPAPEPRPLISGWQIVALVALVLAAAFSLLLLLPPADRRQVLADTGGVFVPYIAPILGAVAAAVAAWAARQARHETAKQTPLIETAVESARTAVVQTNGALSRRDERIRELEALLEAGHAREREAAPPS